MTGMPAVKRPAKRVRLSPEQRRAQLVEVGAQLFAERPYTEVPIDEIARRAGISRGLLFHYFPTKRDYHVAVVEWLGRHMLEHTAPPTITGDPIGTLEDVLTTYLDYVVNNRDSYLALVRGSLGGEERLREIVDRTRDSQVGMAIAALRDAGIDSTPTVTLTVRGWIAFVEEITVSWLREPTVDRGELLALAMRTLPATVFSADAIDAFHLRTQQRRG